MCEDGKKCDEGGTEAQSKTIEALILLAATTMSNRDLVAMASTLICAAIAGELASGTPRAGVEAKVRDIPDVILRTFDKLSDRLPEVFRKVTRTGPPTVSPSELN